MAQLTLQQLNERDRLYERLNSSEISEFTTYDHSGIYQKKVSINHPSFFTNKGIHEVVKGVSKDKNELLRSIAGKKDLLKHNSISNVWDLATLPEISTALGYNAINEDYQRRRLGNFFNTPMGSRELIGRNYYKTQLQVDRETDLVKYLELVYLDLHEPKQLTITATYKKKLAEETLKKELELKSLQTQLGLYQENLQTATLEKEATALDIQESHLELLTFNKLINKIEELHEPEPIETGFDLSSIDTNKLLIVGLALILSVILLIVRKK